MDASPLATLPPEIRDYIYELALTHPSPLTIQEEHGSAPPRIVPGLYGPPMKHILALTQTCKAVHTDTRLMVFSANAFLSAARTISWQRPFLDALESFPLTIGPEAVKALRHVYVACVPLRCLRTGIRWCAIVSNECICCRMFRKRVVEIRQWLLANPSFPATVFLGWSWSPEFSFVDLRDLSKPWIAEVSGLQDPQLRTIMRDLRRRDEVTPSSPAYNVAEMHAAKLASWRDAM